MRYMIDMIDEGEQEHTEIDTPSLERAVRRVKAMMINWGLGEGCSMISVSYTHLTLPTICSV